MDIRCRACGGEFMADDAVEHALKLRFAWAHDVALDESVVPLAKCPNCGLTAYVDAGRGAACAWCSFTQT